MVHQDFIGRKKELALIPSFAVLFRRFIEGAQIEMKKLRT